MRSIIAHSKGLPTLVFVMAAWVFPALSRLEAQESITTKQVEGGTMAFSDLFGLMELPFLFIAIAFSFVTAKALKGGVLGRGMAYLAWGFLVMAVGHLHMQIEHFFHRNLIAEIFGSSGGTVIWFIALVTTWTLSAFGFYSIYTVSKAE